MLKAVQIKRSHDKRICQSSVRQSSLTLSFSPLFFSVAFEKMCTGSSQMLQELNQSSRWRSCSITLKETEEETQAILKLSYPHGAMFVFVSRPRPPPKRLPCRLLPGHGTRGYPLWSTDVCSYLSAFYWQACWLDDLLWTGFWIDSMRKVTKYHKKASCLVENFLLVYCSSLRMIVVDTDVQKKRRWGRFAKRPQRRRARRKGCFGRLEKE